MGARRAGRPCGAAAAAACRTGRCSPWMTSTGTVDRVELVEAARLRAAGAARRLQREREAEHADRARRRGGAAGDARARRAAAGDEPQPAQLAAAQALDDRGPGRVELAPRAQASGGRPRGRAARPARRVKPARSRRPSPRRDRAPTRRRRRRARARARPPASSTRCTCARAGPCGVSISTIFGAATPGASQLEGKPGPGQQLELLERERGRSPRNERGHDRRAAVVGSAAGASARRSGARRPTAAARSAR